MEKITTRVELKDRILSLELRKISEEQALTAHIQEVIQGLRPLNLIKSTLRQATSSSGLKQPLLSTVAGLGAGYLSRKAFFLTGSGGILKKLLGSALQWGVTNLVARHPGQVKSVGGKLLKKIL